jgi:hypothetical protein
MHTYLCIVVGKNNKQGGTKMIEDGIMDKGEGEFKQNATRCEVVAFTNLKILIE